MPLHLYPPRETRSKNWRIRGAYLGTRIDRSAGTPRKSAAHAILKRIEGEIERGLHDPAPGFLSAVNTYLDGGGERRFLTPLVKHFAHSPLALVDQGAIDRAAAVLYPPGITPEPSAHNATINRQVHTPMRAVLAAAGIDLRLRRPRQAPGRVRWINPSEAETFLAAATPKLRRLAGFLLYTGCRLGEATALSWNTVELDRAFAYVRVTKTGDPRAVHLPPQVVAELANAPDKQGRVFGYPHRSNVYEDWHRARRAAGLEDFTPHDLRHTWATWMRRYAGRDLQGLVATGAWANERSAARYAHVVVGEDALAANLLPDVSAVLGRKHT